MLLMGDRRKRRLWNAELVAEPIPFIALLSSARIYLIVVFRGLDVEFIRIDSYDGAIFLVHAFDLEGVLPAAHHVVVELVPGAL